MNYPPTRRNTDPPKYKLINTVNFKILIDQLKSVEYYYYHYQVQLICIDNEPPTWVKAFEGDGELTQRIFIRVK